MHLVVRPLVVLKISKTSIGWVLNNGIMSAVSTPPTNPAPKAHSASHYHWVVGVDPIATN